MRRYLFFTRKQLESPNMACDTHHVNFFEVDKIGE